MTSTNPDYITVGKIGATYGIHGWLKIFTYTEYGANILQYSPWYLISENSDPIIIQLEDAKSHGDGIIAKFAGIDTPEKARLLTGKTIAIARTQLPKLKNNEYYWSDLIGLTVLNKNGDKLGEIAYLIETGSNDVIVIKKDGKEHAIPYLPQSVVISIDLAKREMIVDWELI
ncbi:MAG: 16S rRNA-processing protein RimM [uncultured bacterium]|nr:MAG: 16S rRNA-processing protein RimM [uncultured bacterium]